MKVNVIRNQTKAPINADQPACAAAGASVVIATEQPFPAP
jgi:hypothetical protein